MVWIWHTSDKLVTPAPMHMTLWYSGVLFRISVAIAVIFGGGGGRRFYPAMWGRCPPTFDSAKVHYPPSSTCV
jgi:hypothetical protein